MQGVEGKLVVDEMMTTFMGDGASGGGRTEERVTLQKEPFFLSLLTLLEVLFGLA